MGITNSLSLKAATFVAVSVMTLPVLAAGSEVTIVLYVQPDQVDACQASK